MTFPNPARAWAAGLVLAAAGARAPAQLAAAGAASTDSPNEVVVTATRVAQPAGVALEPILVIGRSALEDSLAVDIGELLRFHAGLDIGRAGGPGQPLALFIRGTDSDHAIVMIDGVRINPGTLGGAPLQNLAPELFERVEVVKGPRSAIYGTDAIGGVVNLITRSSGPSGADAMLGYGRYDSGQFALSGRYTGDAGSVQAALVGQRSAGFPTFALDSEDRGYRNLTGTLSASARIAAVELGAFCWRAQGTSDYAEPVYNSGYTAFAAFTPAAERFADSVYALRASARPLEDWQLRVGVNRSVDDLRQQQADPYASPPARDYDYTARDTLELQNDLRLAGAGQLLTFGGLLSREQTDSLSYGTQYAERTSTQTWYLQDQIAAGRSRLLLAAGDYRHPAFGNHATWNAEYGYAATPALLLTAAAGSAFRAPSATDRFGFGANPQLQPERSRNLELGLRAQLGLARRLGLAAFDNRIDGLIMTVFQPPDYSPLNVNIERARIRGLEASWELRAAAWTLHAEASWQDPRDLVSDTPLLRRSRQSLTLGGSREFGRVEIGVELLQSGPRRDIDAVSGAPVTDGGYLLADLRANFTLSPAWSISARLDNALDRRYQLANGYNSARRGLYLATRYRLH